MCDMSMVFPNAFDAPSAKCHFSIAKTFRSKSETDALTVTKRTTIEVAYNCNKREKQQRVSFQTFSTIKIIKKPVSKVAN